MSDNEIHYFFLILGVHWFGFPLCLLKDVGQLNYVFSVQDHARWNFQPWFLWINIFIFGISYFEILKTGAAF